MTKLTRKVWLAAHHLVHGDRFSVHGVKVTVPQNVDPEIRYMLARKRPYEVPEAKFVQTYLSAGTNVVELGGSIGVISTLVRHQIGPEALHIIVEANPELAAVCKHNASAEAKPNCVDVIEAAVDYSGAAQVMFDFGHNAHTGRVSLQGHPVPTTTLAQVSNRLPDGPAALICDIEGAEFDLIVAETEALKRFELIILETHPHAYTDGPESLETMLSLLASYGFVQTEDADDVVVFTRVNR
ncbi:MAG: FkbM family methyltransferase [Rhodobacteraceae bacterium]|nr:FkbM family methyltransferase [Paracoccaceae bacterium]